MDGGMTEERDGYFRMQLTSLLLPSSLFFHLSIFLLLFSPLLHLKLYRPRRHQFTLVSFRNIPLCNKSRPEPAWRHQLINPALSWCLQSPFFLAVLDLDGVGWDDGAAATPHLPLHYIRSTEVCKTWFTKSEHLDEGSFTYNWTSFCHQ